jgi:hypothetical protein
MAGFGGALGRLTASGFCLLTLAFTSQDAMHRIAIGHPQCLRISCSPSSESGWSMENPCDNSFIRGAAAALV